MKTIQWKYVKASVAFLAFFSAAIAATFTDGSLLVGEDVKPGTYRTLNPEGRCYWTRLKGFSGGIGDILANDIAQGPAVVTILKTDKGFESKGCGTWTSELEPITKSKTADFGSGAFIVDVDIAPGTWSAKPTGNCYWTRLRNFSGGLDSIIANNISKSRVIVSIASSDKGFSSKGCGTWKKI